jgi:thiol-disulfide isomerase/thioredoxin
MKTFQVMIMSAFLGGWLPLALGADAGDQAPGFDLPLLQHDEQAALSDYTGKILYVDFWASWCPPCLVSMPIMNDLRNKLQQQGIDFEVLAVNVDSDPEDGIDFLLDAPVDFVVLSDPAGGTPALYGVKGMPTSYLVDQQGNIVMKHEGFKRRDVDMIEARILALAGQGN